jgi:hypothetical protein
MTEEERREKRRQEIAEMIKRGMENDNLWGFFRTWSSRELLQ